MNPADILTPVNISKHLGPKRRLDSYSPAYELAWLRRQEMRGRLTQKSVDLINEKWRLRYKLVCLKDERGLW
jgi:hypothetical protein